MDLRPLLIVVSTEIHVDICGEDKEATITAIISTCAPKARSIFVPLVCWVSGVRGAHHTCIRYMYDHQAGRTRLAITFSLQVLLLFAGLAAFFSPPPCSEES